MHPFRLQYGNQIHSPKQLSMIDIVFKRHSNYLIDECEYRYGVGLVLVATLGPERGATGGYARLKGKTPSWRARPRSYESVEEGISLD